jgi:hypothetical protein
MSQLGHLLPISAAQAMSGHPSTADIDKPEASRVVFVLVASIQRWLSVNHSTLEQ